MNECLFCRIASGAIPATFLYQDAACVAFADIHPKAPVHILIVPREHIASLQALRPDQRELGSQLLAAVQQVAAQTGVADTGYRLITNVGANAGQIVPHLHWHLLGGKHLGPKIVD